MLRQAQHPLEPASYDAGGDVLIDRTGLEHIAKRLADLLQGHTGRPPGQRRVVLQQPCRGPGRTCKGVLGQVGIAPQRRNGGGDLTPEDFHKLSEVGVFHPAHMNEAIWQFRLFERASLDYLGTAPDDQMARPIGLWDHSITDQQLSSS